ncbi:MAG: LLM class flavin-dependent oxidoreductase [Dehalococcoidia bacterium]|nr:LLM class flavin-dependent oxidoreductase [Dehalococcoidia bacterium]
MVKVMLQIYPVMPAASEEERIAMRPLGRNAEVYQETIAGVHDLVRAADDLGFWGCATIEHHFHSEGYEVGPQPGILNAYWAAITKNVRIGQLGYVMSAQNPIRVAEEAAILDHLLKGRSFVGFARGYQARWTNTLGQHLGTRATRSPEAQTAERRAELGEEVFKKLGSDDEVNRRLFEEQIEIVLKAWTQETVEHDSPLWQIPYPYDTGTEWPMYSTADLGAPGEMPDRKHVRKVSVVPSPYTKPHPPVFVASSASPATVEYCARKGFIPTYFAGIRGPASLGPQYVEWAKEAGHDFGVGQNQALVRWIQIGKDMDEARQKILRYDAEIQKHFYSQTSSSQYRGDTAGYNWNDWVDATLNTGLWIAGSLEDVKRQYIEQWKQLPAEYAVIICHYAQQPLESVVENLSQFMEHIKPELDEMTAYSQEPVAAGR